MYSVRTILSIGRCRSLFGLSGIAANFVAFVYMDVHNIGLTVDTLPVISLGIGLGVDYGIYTVARIRDEVVNGLTLDQAVTKGLRSTGVWVFCTFAVMVGGILAWVFSPLLFHSEMSLLLVLLMTTNLIAGVLLLPALIGWDGRGSSVVMNEARSPRTRLRPSHLSLSIT